MDDWDNNTPENIRVCASSPPFRIIMTWYRSGDVIRTDLQTGDWSVVGYARTLDRFNEILYEYEVMPMGFGRKGKVKEEKKELATLPF